MRDNSIPLQLARGSDTNITSSSAAARQEFDMSHTSPYVPKWFHTKQVISGRCQRAMRPRYWCFNKHPASCESLHGNVICFEEKNLFDTICLEYRIEYVSATGNYNFTLFGHTIAWKQYNWGWLFSSIYFSFTETWFIRIWSGRRLNNVCWMLVTETRHTWSLHIDTLLWHFWRNDLVTNQLNHLHYVYF